MAPEPGFEHSELKGVTLKNMIVTIACTATIVATGVGAYSGIQKSIDNLGYRQDEQNKLIDLRIRTLEDQQKLMNIEIRELQTRQR